MAMNVSIMQCANCGRYLEDEGEDIIGFTTHEYMGIVFLDKEDLIGYCCSKCGYMEGV